jgi:hypothetical protein
MTNEISSFDFPKAVPPRTLFSLPNEDGIQIANHGTINLFLDGHNGTASTVGAAFNTDYYNLFVVKEELFEAADFFISKERAITVPEGSASDVCTEFSSLTPEAITKIKTFPSLFASENHSRRSTDPNHYALFGLVTDIKVQEKGYKIHFQRFCSVPQQALNDNAFKLGIYEMDTYNELNRAHWAIKPVNLINVLKKIGISVLVPT